MNNMMTPLTSEESDYHDRLIDLARQDQVGLMRARDTRTGEYRAVLITLHDDPDDRDNVIVEPMGLLMDQDLFDHLVPVGEPERVATGSQPRRYDMGDLNDPFNGPMSVA